MRIALAIVVGVALTGGSAEAGAKAPPRKAVAKSVAKPATPATPLDRLLAIARSDAKRMDADRFADPTPTPEDMVGEPFRVILPTSGLQTSANAVYQDGKLTMYLKLDAVLDDRDYHTPVSQWRHDKMIELSGAVQSRGSYLGSNAFGATREVSVANWSSSAIVAVRVPQADLFPGTEAYATARTERDTYPLVLTTTGAEAKSLLATTRIVVEGTIAPLSNGKLMGCSDHYHTPTLDAPISGRSRTCWVGGDISRIAYVNSVTGEVLKEWKDEVDLAADAARLESANHEASVTATRDLIERYYPDVARRKEARGSATLQCEMSQYGDLRFCEVISESETGMGFGDAALNIARYQKGEPKTVSGKRVSSSVRFTISFEP